MLRHNNRLFWLLAIAIVLAACFVPAQSPTQPPSPLARGIVPVSPLLPPLPRQLIPALPNPSLVYLPHVERMDAPPPEGTPIPTADGFVPLPQELAMASLLTVAGQNRPLLRYNEILSRCARQKAHDMATRQYFAHVDPEGWGPNYRARQCGYSLASSYPDGDSNSIESLAAGRPTAAEMWPYLMASPPHRAHLLGERPFFLAQIDYGIGFAQSDSAPYRWYWAIWIAQPEGANAAAVQNVLELESILGIKP